MGGPSQTSDSTLRALVTELAQSLTLDEPERALEVALQQLQYYGFNRTPSEQPPTLDLRCKSERLRLWRSTALDEETGKPLAALLELALLRVAECKQHRETQERLEMLSNASFEGIMVHVDGDIIYANAKLAELLASSPEELLGPATMRACVAPEDLPQVMERLRSGYEGAYVITGVRKDGSRFRAELQAKQGRLGTKPIRVAAVRDVTERERLLELLYESEARLSELAEAVFDVTVSSRDGIIVQVSGDVEGLLGLSRESTLGRPILDFVAPSSTELTRQQLAAGRPGRYRSVLKGHDELIPVEVVAVNSSLEGKRTRVAGIRDLRTDYRREQERHQLERQVERSQRLDSLGVLAGGIAHDFNNLLVGIMGNADLLLSQPLDNDTADAVAAILDAANKAAALTNQMLAYAGRAKVDSPSLLNLGELVEELRRLLSATLSKKAELTISAEPNCTILADRTRMTQVVMNLLTNASDALGERSGRIQVDIRRTTKLDERWDRALGATVGPGDWVICEVQDSGDGMSAETQSRVFEPFFTTKAKGHGLGLAACVGIVTSHGGAVHVDSEIGVGTRFSLLLPFAAPSELAATRERISVPPATHILLIDDEEVVRAQLRRSLELRGHKVTAASRGADGLKIPLDDVNLIILDMRMPDLDGPEVVRRLRERGDKTPILLSSAFLDRTAEALLAAGSVQALLSKPYAVTELLNAMERALAVETRRAAPGT